MDKTINRIMRRIIQDGIEVTESFIIKLQDKQAQHYTENRAKMLKDLILSIRSDQDWEKVYFSYFEIYEYMREVNLTFRAEWPKFKRDVKAGRHTKAYFNNLVKRQEEQKAKWKK